MPLSPEMTPGSLPPLLGESEPMFEDEEEVILCFKNGDVRLEMAFTPDRKRPMRMEGYNDNE